MPTGSAETNSRLRYLYAARDLGSREQCRVDRAGFHKALDHRLPSLRKSGPSDVHVHVLHTVVSGPDVLPADRDGHRHRIEPGALGLRAHNQRYTGRE